MGAVTSEFPTSAYIIEPIKRWTQEQWIVVNRYISLNEKAWASV